MVWGAGVKHAIETMEPQTMFIPGQLPGMNEMIASAKQANGKWNGYAAMKKQWNANVAVFARRDKLRPTGRVRVVFEWVEQSKRRDPDNVSAAKKLVLDGLVACGVLAGDGPTVIAGLEDRFSYSRTNPGVRVTLEPVTRECT